MEMEKEPVRERERERVCIFIKQQVPDWDDDVPALARFKAFTGQRPDWEPRFLFWRDLILKVARHLGIFILQPSHVKTTWFARKGLNPLCIDHVLLEMHRNGDVLLLRDLSDPTSGFLYRTGKRLGLLFGRLRGSTIPDTLKEPLVLKQLLQERADTLIQLLCQNQWNSTCIITLEKFRSNCEEPGEAVAVLNYLVGAGKAQYFSSDGKYCIQGVKLSLARSNLNLTVLDRDSLRLIWTIENLEQKLRFLDECSQKSKRSAFQCLKYGNKQAALRYVRQIRLVSQSQEQCASLLNRVEEVHNAIANAEATKEVAEAVRIGARTMKENSINLDELHIHIQALDDAVGMQRLTEDTLVSRPFFTTEIEDAEVEDELKRLEEDLECGVSVTQSSEAAKGVTYSQETVSDSAESISESLSSLKLEAA